MFSTDGRQTTLLEGQRFPVKELKRGVGGGIHSCMFVMASADESYVSHEYNSLCVAQNIGVSEVQFVPQRLYEHHSTHKSDKRDIITALTIAGLQDVKVCKSFCILPIFSPLHHSDLAP